MLTRPGMGSATKLELHTGDLVPFYVRTLIDTGELRT